MSGPGNVGGRGAAQRQVGSRGWAITSTDDADRPMIARSRPPLIGRTAEFGLLRAAATAAANGQASVAVIDGSAGIGRSRLLEETYRFARDELDSTATLLRCQSSSPDDFGVLRTLAMVDADGRPTHIGGDTLAAQALSWANAIIEQASRSSTALFVDDVHLADAGTVAVITQLLRRLRNGVRNQACSLLLVLTGSGAELDSKLAALVGADESDDSSDDAGSAQVRIRLAPLDMLQSIDLVKHLALGEVPRVVAETIAERCEGNPLAIRTVTDLLLAQRRVGPSARDRQLVSTDIDSWALARSPDLVIESHFAGLDDRLRSFLAVAAVAESLPLSMTAALVEMDDELVDELAAKAVDERVLEYVDPVRFAHPIYRDRALAELPVGEVQQLRGRVADMLIASGSAGPLEVVRHLRGAGASVPDEKLMEFGILAGRSALADRSWGAAARSFQLAATAARRLRSVPSSQLAELYRETAEALVASGDVDDARLWATRGAELCEGSGDHQGWAEATVQAVRCAVWSGRFGERVDIEALARIAQDEELPAALRAEAKLVASETAWMAGEAAEALEWANNALDDAATLADQMLGARARISIATSHWLRLELRPARAQLEAATAYVSDERDDPVVATSIGRLALNTLWLGDVERARATAGAACAAADRANTPLERAVPLAAIGAIAALQGEHEQVALAAAEAWLLGSVSGDRWAEMLAVPTWLASAAWAGDLREATSVLRRWHADLLLVHATLRGPSAVMVEAYGIYLEILAGSVDHRSWLTAMTPHRDSAAAPAVTIGGSSFFSMLIDCADRLEMPEVAEAVLPHLVEGLERGEVIAAGWPALVSRSLAQAERMVGRTHTALHRAIEAETFAAEAGLTVEQCRAQIEIARCHATIGHDTEARAALQQAHAMALSSGLAGLRVEAQAVRLNSEGA